MGTQDWLTSMSKKDAPVLGRLMSKRFPLAVFWMARTTMILPNMGRRLMRKPELSSGENRSCSSFLSAASQSIPLSVTRSVLSVWSPEWWSVQTTYHSTLGVKTRHTLGSWPSLRAAWAPIISHDRVGALHSALAPVRWHRKVYTKVAGFPSVTY